MSFPFVSNVSVARVTQTASLESWDITFLENAGNIGLFNATDPASGIWFEPVRDGNTRLLNGTVSFAFLDTVLDIGVWETHEKIEESMPHYVHDLQTPRYYSFDERVIEFSVDTTLGDLLNTVGSLEGTLAGVEVDILQDYSDQNWTFALSFDNGERWSSALNCDDEQTVLVHPFGNFTVHLAEQRLGSCSLEITYPPASTATAFPLVQPEIKVKRLSGSSFEHSTETLQRMTLPEIQRVQIKGDFISGSFSLVVGNKWAEDVSYEASASEVQQALTRLNIGEVYVVKEAAGTWRVSFESLPGDHPLMVALPRDRHGQQTLYGAVSGLYPEITINQIQRGTAEPLSGDFHIVSSNMACAVPHNATTQVLTSRMKSCFNISILQTWREDIDHGLRWMFRVEGDDLTKMRALRLNDDALAGTNKGVALSITESAPRAEVQELTLPFGEDNVFQCKVKRSDVSFMLVFGTSAEWIKDVMNEAEAAYGQVRVSRQDDSTFNQRSWLITFASKLVMLTTTSLTALEMAI